MTSERPLDPGAFIGSEPEREAETIPGGVTAKDERVAAYASRPGVEGEPEDVPEHAPGTPDVVVPIGEPLFVEPIDPEGSADLEALAGVEEITPKDPPSGGNATDR